MATVEQKQQQTAPQLPPAQRRPGPRRIRVTIQRVNPWSVLKFSLVFYFCLMLIVVIGLAILYMLMDALGIVESVETFIGSFFPPDPGQPVFRINSGFLFRTIFLIGLVWVVVWSALTVFVTFLYNLISDLVGGIDVTLREKR